MAGADSKALPLPTWGGCMSRSKVELFREIPEVYWEYLRRAKNSSKSTISPQKLTRVSEILSFNCETKKSLRSRKMFRWANTPAESITCTSHWRSLRSGARTPVLHPATAQRSRLGNGKTASRVREQTLGRGRKNALKSLNSLIKLVKPRVFTGDFTFPCIFLLTLPRLSA